MIFDPLDPLRPPDWRWQNVRYAESIHQGTKDAKLMRRYMSQDFYLKLAHKARRVMVKESNRMPKLIRASAFHIPRFLPYDVQCVSNAETYVYDTSSFSKFGFYKALVLGSVPPSLMTDLTDESQDFIRVLNPIFFDVGQRLNDKAFIWSQVIRTDVKKGLLDNVDGLWQECAYLGGCLRMLYLRARGNVKDLFRSARSMEYTKPTMKDYLNPEKVSKQVLKVIQSRMNPDPNRTIEDLRKLYLSLPGKLQRQPVSPSPAVPQKNGFVTGPSTQVVDPNTRESQRRLAEVVDWLNFNPVP